MRELAKEWRVLVLGTAALALSPAFAPDAFAAKSHRAGASPLPIVYHPSAKSSGGSGRSGAEIHLTMHAGHLMIHDAVYHPMSKHSLSKGGKATYGHGSYYSSYSYSYGGLQCVPFARAASGIELKGNAADWWYAAAGVYDRGNRPEPGSVLNFRATGGMRLGHVAVVADVVNDREIEVDHANWAGPGESKGGVSRGVHVIDVSPENDWTEVRVALGQTGGFGSTYPTYGFIYDRPDTGMMMANNSSARVTFAAASNEVAEAPEVFHRAPEVFHHTKLRLAVHHPLHPTTKHRS